jgi:acyl-CoA hydrolase/RimJ/RimL family protein N-acetyltransferase
MVEALSTSYATKLVSAAVAVTVVKPGHKVFTGTGCATPLALIGALEAVRPAPSDVEIFHFLTSGLRGVMGNQPSQYRHRCYFVGADMVDYVRRGTAEYVPISLTQIPRLVENGRIRADVALIQVSPPNDHGFVSLGISVDIANSILRHARTIIAEVNRHMPRTHGETLVHIDRIKHLVAVDTPIGEFVHEPIDEVAERVARYVAEIIDDGSTLHIDLGQIPNEALRFLGGRRDLGIHSNVITDSLVDLYERGIVTGRHKTIHQGKIVTSFCFGTKRLYNFVHDNPLVEFHPIEYVADAAVLARNHKMVSLTQAFALDLTGQICADQLTGTFYGGVSTVPDFQRGAALSIGGKPIVCLRATTDGDLESRIRPQLLPGEGVTLARSDVHYVVTEFGVAYLFGKSVRERALSLIEIAHPSFRGKLLESARSLGLVSAAQRLPSRRPYLVEEERAVTLKNSKSVLLRPARASDVVGMQSIFHRMSADDTYMRFFRRLRTLSFEEAQRLCNVDFEGNVAFVAVIGPREHEELIGTGAYVVNPSTNLAEIAFMVVPEWQGTGLGSALLTRLQEFAVSRRVRGFVAEVMHRNTGMLNLAKKLGGSVEIVREGEILEMTAVF